MDDPSMSVVDTDAFQILYAFSQEARNQFLDHGIPLDPEKLLSNRRFVNWLRCEEPRSTIPPFHAQHDLTTDDLTFERLEPLLPILQSTQAGYDAGLIIQEFIRIHKEWYRLASSFHNFDIFSRLVTAFYVSRDDGKLNWFFRSWTETHPDTFQIRCKLYNDKTFYDQVRTNWWTIADAFTASTERLKVLKSDPRLHVAIALFYDAEVRWTREQQLKVLHHKKKDVLHKYAAAQKTMQKMVLKLTNEQLTSRQQGNGSRLPFPPHVVETIKGMFDGMQQKYIEDAGGHVASNLGGGSSTQV